MRGAGRPPRTTAVASFPYPIPSFLQPSCHSREGGNLVAYIHRTADDRDRSNWTSETLSGSKPPLHVLLNRHALDLSLAVALHILAAYELTVQAAGGEGLPLSSELGVQVVVCRLPLRRDLDDLVVGCHIATPISIFSIV